MTAPRPLRRARAVAAWSCAALSAALLLGTAPAASAETTPKPASGKLTWAPPQLTSPTTVRVTSSTRTLKLKDGQDYVIDLPSTPVTLRGGLNIIGGRNVVMIGGQITSTKDAKGAARGMYLKGQTGTVHIEGVRMGGPGFTEGFDLDERKGAVVQIQNVRVDTVHGSYSTNHADVLQTWAGPRRLRVDRLDGSTAYQGFFLDPGKFGNQPAPELFDIRNTVLRDSGGTSAYLLWQSGRFPIRTTAVTVSGNTKKGFPKQVLRSKFAQTSWSAVAKATGSAASPLLGQPGTGYTSPGYAGGGSDGTTTGSGSDGTTGDGADGGTTGSGTTDGGSSDGTTTGSGSKGSGSKGSGSKGDGSDPKPVQPVVDEH